MDISKHITAVALADGVGTLRRGTSSSRIVATAHATDLTCDEFPNMLFLIAAQVPERVGRGISHSLLYPPIPSTSRPSRPSPFPFLIHALPSPLLPLPLPYISYPLPLPSQSPFPSPPLPLPSPPPALPVSPPSTRRGASDNGGASACVCVRARACGSACAHE
jgi:hypothetical protein